MTFFICMCLYVLLLLLRIDNCLVKIMFLPFSSLLYTLDLHVWLQSKNSFFYSRKLRFLTDFNLTLFTIFTLLSRLTHTRTIHMITLLRFLTDFSLFTIFTLPSRLTHTRTIHIIPFLWFLTDFTFTLFTICTLPSRLTHTGTIHMITLFWFLTVDGACLTAVLAKNAHVTFCNFNFNYAFIQILII